MGVFLQNVQTGVIGGAIRDWDGNVRSFSGPMESQDAREAVTPLKVKPGLCVRLGPIKNFSQTLINSNLAPIVSQLDRRLL